MLKRMIGHAAQRLRGLFVTDRVVRRVAAQIFPCEPRLLFSLPDFAGSNVGSTSTTPFTYSEPFSADSLPSGIPSGLDGFKGT